MRLLTVIHGLQFGGAHNQALRLADPLRRRGIETIAVLPAGAELAAERLREGGVETHLLRLGRLRARLDPVPQLKFVAGLRGELAGLRDLFRKLSVDIVQAHGVTNPQAAVAARQSGVAVAYQLLDTRAPMPVRRLMMPLVVRLADVMTCWGRELANLHPGAMRLGERLVFVFPPVDTQELAPNSGARAAARDELAIPPDAVAIGTLAVRNPQKGIEWFLRAADRVQALTDRSVVFRVLGTTSPGHEHYERALREEARARGLVPPALDFVDPGDAPHRFLHALDVFALTSVPRSEGVPTVILEAMACGKPVVATNVAAVGDLVDHGKTGLLVPAEDAGTIAAGFARLILDAKLRESLGEAGRASALEHFDLGRLADLHAGAYEVGLEHGRRRTGRTGL